MQDLWDLAIDPSNPAIMYAASGGDGVFKSTDGGDTWNPVNSGLPITSFDGGEQNQVFAFALAIDPNATGTLYVGTGKGPYKSTNGGASWQASATGLPPSSGIRSITIDPRDPSVIYVGTNNAVVGGFFKSVNGGASWTALPGANPESSYEVGATAIDPTTPATLYVGTGDVRRSTDGGATWQNGNVGASSITSLTVDPANSGVVYATSFSGVYRSGDRGLTWTALNNGINQLDTRSLAIDPRNSSVLYVGTYDEVYKSTNGGLSWVPLGGPGAPSWVMGLAITPSGTVFAGSYRDGIYRLTLADPVPPGTQPVPPGGNPVGGSPAPALPASSTTPQVPVAALTIGAPALRVSSFGTKIRLSLRLNLPAAAKGRLAVIQRKIGKKKWAALSTLTVPAGGQIARTFILRRAALKGARRVSLRVVLRANATVRAATGAARTVRVPAT